MKPLTRVLVAVNLAFILLFTLWLVVQKESLLAEGELLLFRLAPVDPRSLIQGDYMRLDYAMARNIQRDSLPPRGYVVVRKGNDDVAEFVRMQESPAGLAASEYAVPYRSNGRRAHFGGESYLFQEGRADDFAKARYGALRVDRAGNTLLSGLYDEYLRRID